MEKDWLRDDKLTFKSHEYPKGMDAEVIDLCNAINSLPNLRTNESCWGHGDMPFQIWFELTPAKATQGYQNQGLFFITRCVDRRYWGRDWSISLEVGDVIHKDNVLPTLFLLSSNKSKGKKALKEARELFDNMEYHLNHENFTDGFHLDIDKFDTEPYKLELTN